MMATQAQLPVSAKTLGMLFELTYTVFHRNTEGISHDDSVQSPDPAGNCMNWVAGHVVVSRDGLLQLLGQSPVWGADEAATYKRGSAPLTDPSKALPWPAIVSALESSQERLRAGLAALTPEQLASPMPADRNPFGVGSMGETIAALSFHESYHMGQFGILRRLSGRKGAIQ